MESNYNLILEPFKGNKSRHTCPSCGKRSEFSRYINTQTGEYVADHVGRCNREVNCKYHYTPKQFFQDNPDANNSDSDWRNEKPIAKPKAIEAVKPPDRLPIELFEKTLSRYDQNHFYSFLKLLFGDIIATDLINRYCVGTSKHWPGANVFWQVDYDGNIRQAKTMLYNPITGKRIRDEETKPKVIGRKILNNWKANLVLCFFGEILLSMSPNKKVAIVESEKTAIIASAYFPDLVWLATGGSSGCKWRTDDKVCEVLEGRKVILFPDLGCYELWKKRADDLNDKIKYTIYVSDLLEKNATEDQKKSGLDLADFLLMNRDSSGWALTTEGYPLFWDIKISA